MDLNTTFESLVGDDPHQKHVDNLRKATGSGKHLILVRGIPGSGKSTFADKAAAAIGAKVHTTDDFFVDKNGNYNWDGNKVRRAHEWNQDRTDSALQAGHNVIVPNTMTTAKEMRPYLDMAKKHGAKVHVYRAVFPGKNVHGVPDETLRKMADRFQPHPGEIELK